MITLLNKGLEAIAMTQEKSTDNGIEVLRLGTLQPLSFFGQVTNPMESKQVTTEAASPGILTRMDVVDPPYMDP